MFMVFIYPIKQKVRKGALLIGLAFGILLLSISAMVGYLEGPTLFLRYDENILKNQLDGIRFSLDRYRIDSTNAGTSSFTTLVALMVNNGVASGLFRLYNEGYLRESYFKNPLTDLASESWVYHRNLVFNSGFEIDDSTVYKVGVATSGNSVSGDLVPNGWELIQNGAQQVVGNLEPNKIYVASFWVKASNPTKDKCYLQVSSGATLLGNITGVGDEGVWKRFFTSFSSGASPLATFSVTLTLGHTLGTGFNGESAFFDSIQLENCLNPQNPFPSIWTDDGEVIAGNFASTSLKQVFTQVGTDTPIANTAGTIIKYGYF